MFKNQANSENKEYAKQKTNSSKTKKVITAILATITGFSSVTVASAVIAHEAMFARYERPDYSLYPGEYYYERVKDRLPRQEFYYQTKLAKLKGYYYPSMEGKGLVVVAHGFHAGADDYLPLIEYVVQNGYNVFAYDTTGTYDSEGDSTVGMCQSLVDLDNTLSYIKSTSAYSGMPLFLIGHSWGGYAVSSVLALHEGIKACACIAPMNSGFKIMLEKGEQYVGKLATTTKPIINAYQKILFGDYIEYDGVRGINSVDIPVFIAQGVDDKIITYNGQSITAHKSEITNPNVIYYDGVGTYGDHNNIWHSQESALYQKQVESELKSLRRQKGEKLTNEEKAAYYATVNHALYSEVNKPLLDKIIKMFDGTF
jgi:cephalosporin-C deacetylase-like acetyl esterase